MLSPDPPETGLWWSGVQDLGILGFQFGGWLRASGLWGFGFHGFRLLVQRALEVESLEDGSSRISPGLAFAGFSMKALSRSNLRCGAWSWSFPGDGLHHDARCGCAQFLLIQVAFDSSLLS